MKTIGMTPRLWTSAAALHCAAGLLLVGGSAAGQGGNLYEGHGFVEELSSGPGVRSVAFGDFTGDGRLDLLHWRANGDLFLHDRFAEYDHRTLIANVSAFAVTHGGSDRIWGVTGTNLVEVRWNGSQWTTVTVTVPITITGAASLRAQERPLGSRLLLLDTTGTRVSVFHVPSLGVPAYSSSRTTSGTEGTYKDAVLVKWGNTGGDGLAFACDAGVKVLNDAGGLITGIPVAPDDVFLDVLPAADTQWGQDLLLVHFRFTPTAAAYFLAANSDHTESHFVEPLHIESFCIANLTPNPGPTPRREVILPRGDERGALVMVQQHTALETDQVLDFSATECNTISTAGLEDDSPFIEPGRHAVADLDGDLDEDVLFVDDRRLAFVVKSEIQVREIEDDTLPNVDNGRFLLTIDLDPAAGALPAGTTTLQLEIWLQPDVLSPVAGTSHYAASITPDSQGLFLHSVDIPSGDIEQVYHILLRALADSTTLATRVNVWSEDLAVLNGLVIETSEFFPWTPGVDAGGTAERPKISPGGPH